MSNNIVSESRAVSAFDRVSLRTMGDMTIVQGASEGLSIEADADLMPKIRTEVKDGRLIIDIGRDWWERLTGGFLAHSRVLKYHVSMREIHGLELSGAGTINSESIVTDHLTVNVSGAVQVRVGSLTAQSLAVNISGRGEFEATGVAGKQVVTVSGSGEYRAGDLAGDTVEVKISGHGNARVRPIDSLEVTISGMGNVEYSGTPSVSQRISGMGTVRKLDGPQ